MTAPRFEIVRTDAGWHSRFRASNGQIIASTEVYTRRRGALRAVELLAGTKVYYSPFQGWPEIKHGRGPDARLIEIWEVDAR